MPDHCKPYTTQEMSILCRIQTSSIVQDMQEMVKRVSPFSTRWEWFFQGFRVLLQEQSIGFAVRVQCRHYKTSSTHPPI